MLIGGALGPHAAAGPRLADQLHHLGAEFVAVTDGPAPAGCQALVTFGVERDHIAPALTDEVQWVHVLATGVDGFPFDLVRGRLLTCSRGASAVAIAEFVMAAMLAFEKKFPESWIREPPERWGSASLGTLSGRTLGLIGLGAIGTETARRALAFDMTVVAIRRRPEQSAPPGVTLAPSLSALLEQSDHLVVAAPATPASHHLLNAQTLRALRPGAHVINISRGTLIDHDALIAALDDGRIARATLDVTDPEPLPIGHPLYEHPGVRLTPHISWCGATTMQATFDRFFDNVTRRTQGRELQGVVDLDEGY
jgi:phosphoglycerate dehydrogenase-like enzyme